MPERADKNGPPSLAIKIQCQHAECRHARVVTGVDAARMAARLAAYSRREGRLHMRELIAIEECAKCKRRFVSLHFKLHYSGWTLKPRQHHDAAQFTPNPI